MKGAGMDSAPPRFKWDGKLVSAGWVTTFSDYTIASENRVTPIASDVRFDIASLLGCAVTTGLGIVFNNADMKPGQSVAVFGVGGVGLNVLQGAALVNATPIVAIDLHDDKLERAKSFGATHAAKFTDPELRTLLKELAGSRLFDVTVDTTGNGDVIRMAYESTADAGTTILAGVPPHQQRITIDSFPLHFGRRLLGSHGGDTDPDADIPRYLRLYKHGRLKLEEQITHRYHLEEINEAVAEMRRGATNRCVISAWHARWRSQVPSVAAGAPARAAP
jgi:S-(hydroxymethyl)glutathione dehydrogenase/alcohol dehydrogenase